MGGTYLRLNPADLIRIFQPEQHLVIILNRSAGDDENVEQNSFTARMVKIENDQLVLALLSISSNDSDPLQVGRVITIETGRSNGMFTFKSKIISRNNTDGTIHIESPKILASKERRQGPRVPLNVPVVYRVVSFREQKLNHLSNKIGLGESQDLAEGGITLLTDLKLPIGLILIVEFALEGEDVSLAGMVRRVVPTNHLQHSFAIGIKFLEPGQNHQELISRAIEKSGERFRGKISM